jgi:hypothetical protein
LQGRHCHWSAILYFGLFIAESLPILCYCINRHLHIGPEIASAVAIDIVALFDLTNWGARSAVQFDKMGSGGQY